MNFHGSMYNDIIYGTKLADMLDGLYGDDIIYGGLGNDIITGGWGQDTLYGGDGADNINGGWGQDYLYGGTGADTIDGGHGQDFLYGGFGADTFKFASTVDSTATAPDTIMDFKSGQDKLDFTSLHLTANSITIYDRRVDVDTNHDGVIDMRVQLNTHIHLSDIIW